MKNIFIAFTTAIILVACKKDNNVPTPTPTPPPTDTTSVSDSCGGNPNINFKHIGEAIGKFSYCIKDVDGNVYKTIIIGSQQWMAENLKTSKYNDGTPIPKIEDKIKFESDTLGAWRAHSDKYGKAYNWYVVSNVHNGNKNVCPTGWHVPSIDEFQILIDSLGGIEVAGDKMREIGNTSWKSQYSGLENASTNSSLFTGIPSRYGNSEVEGRWVSTTQFFYEVNKFLPWVIRLNTHMSLVTVNASYHGDFSIRCVKD